MFLRPESEKKYNAQRKTSNTSLPCWAPFRSMYFGFRGNTSVCCFNKMHVIGTYPAQSIREIWFGAKADEIRQSLSKNDFSLGCQSCHELITAENYSGLPAKNFDPLPINPNRFPSKIDFELSNECNLECIMCRGEFSSAIRRNREKLPPIPSVYDLKFVDQLEEFIPYLENSHFLGGEPFMIPIYVDIWERMIQINPKIRISVQTNGTILTQRIKSLMEKITFEIAVSIDSIYEENYQLIRKNGNFNTLLENIRYFRNYCRERNTNFHLSYCPMVQNWQELPHVIEFANQLECAVFFNTVSFPQECALSFLPSEELSKIIAELLAAQLPENTIMESSNKKVYSDLLQQLNHWFTQAQTKEAFAKNQPKIDNLSTYLIQLESYIAEKKDISADTRQELMADITSKLNHILSVARTHGMEKTAEDHLIAMDFKTIYESVPAVDAVHLVTLFQSFIMPLPE
jgi:sulfatase maturation enzyme AslB (radical SAM superfamily)